MKSSIQTLSQDQINAVSGGVSQDELDAIAKLHPNTKAALISMIAQGKSKEVSKYLKENGLINY